MSESWPYESDRALLLCYEQKTFPEDFLVRLYYQTDKDELVEPVFAGWEGLHLNSFVGYLKDKTILVAFLKESYAVDRVPAGYAWLQSVEGKDGARKASVGFLFFRRVWGRKELREVSRMALSYWFNELNIDVLFGPMLQSNRMAKRFAAELGFQRVCDLPNWLVQGDALVACSLMMLTRERFRQQQVSPNHAPDQHPSNG